MKVIVTGGTGSVGSAALQQCIEHPDVTSIVALTRRPLEVQDSKLESVIVKDFLNYDDTVIEKMKGAGACIWALGAPTSGKEVHIDYPQTALKVLLASVVPKEPNGRPFRFVYTSGGLVPMLEKISFISELLAARAVLDREILDVEKQNPGRWESFVVRPWFVVDAPPTTRFIFPGAWILRPVLGSGMLDAALNGAESRMLDNSAVRSIGEAALEKRKS